MSDEINNVITSEDEDLPIINRTSRYTVDNRLIYDYNHESGLLSLDIDKREYAELIRNLGEFPKEGASFCFFLPKKGEVCFMGVQKIQCLNQEGFIKRITRILRRRKK